MPPKLVNKFMSTNKNKRKKKKKKTFKVIVSQIESSFFTHRKFYI